MFKDIKDEPSPDAEADKPEVKDADLVKLVPEKVRAGNIACSSSALETVLFLDYVLFNASVRHYKDFYDHLDDLSKKKIENCFFSRFCVNQKKETFLNLHRITSILMSMA